MKAKSIQTKKLKSTTLDLQADRIHGVAIEAQILHLLGNEIEVGKKVGVTGWGLIQGNERVKLGAVYSTKLSVECSNIEIGSVNGDIKATGTNIILDSLEG